MEEAKRQALLRCVKKDDAKGFRKILSPDLFSVVFGRFPLLSLLYLYDAKRIVKRHFAELMKDRPRTEEGAILEAEARFRALAGKSLRYFADREVSPLEMLAVLGRRRELIKTYARYPNARRVLPSLNRIYFTRLGKGVTVLGDKLILPPEPISHAERVGGLRAAWVSLAVALSFSVCVGALSGYFGLGVGGSYSRVRSVGTLASAIKHEQNISLQSDLTLSSGAQAYAAVFEGNDHVVRLTEPLFETFEGEMRNVTFVLASDFRGDGVILENKGTLTNVKVRAEGQSLEKGGEYMALLAAVNRGTISDCEATLSLSLSGDAGGDCYFAPFAGDNYGTICNCAAKGVVTGRNVDLAGIVGKNEKSGEVTSCRVDIELSESSDIKGWTPNVAGITDHNDGVISDCEVKGIVESILLSPLLDEEDRAASAYAAGVSCVNVGKIKNALVLATVRAEGTNGAAFAGGIACFNTTDGEDESIVGSTENCTLRGDVKATTHSAHNVYAGGIVGHNVGTVTACEAEGSIIAILLSPALEEGASASASYAGGITAVNVGVVRESVDRAPVTAESTNGAAFAGGIASLNRTVSDDPTVYAYIEHCSGLADVSAIAHSAYNSYAGGIAAINDSGSLISASRQTAHVSAESAGNLYRYIGGIVGNNRGGVETSFFIGTLPERGEAYLVGEICGITYLYQNFFGQYYLDMANNAYVKSDNYACGALQPVGQNTFYSVDYLVSEHAESLLEYRTTAAESTEALKALEIYYE